VLIFFVATTQICVIFGFSIQNLTCRNTKISTLARFQPKSHFENKNLKSAVILTQIRVSSSKLRVLNPKPRDPTRSFGFLHFFIVSQNIF
jgi:hypothetical protein